MNRNRIVITVVLSVILIIAFLFGFIALYNAPGHASAQSTTTASGLDPWTLSCSELHSNILSFQDQLLAGNTIGNQIQAVQISGLLNYFTNVYNERLSLYFTSSAIDGCPYP